MRKVSQLGILILNRIFRSLVVLLTLVVLLGISKRSFAAEQEYYLFLNPSETEYKISDKLFEIQIDNAYPGLKLPVKKIHITNQYHKMISIQINMDLIEPDLDWLDIVVKFEQAGVSNTIKLDLQERNFEDEQIQLSADETITLEVHYILNDEKIVNEYQERFFRTKWNLVCKVEERRNDLNLPNTGEKNNIIWKFKIIVGLWMCTLCFCVKYKIKEY